MWVSVREWQKGVGGMKNNEVWTGSVSERRERYQHFNE